MDKTFTEGDAGNMIAYRGVAGKFLLGGWIGPDIVEPGKGKKILAFELEVVPGKGCLDVVHFVRLIEAGCWNETASSSKRLTIGSKGGDCLRLCIDGFIFIREVLIISKIRKRGKSVGNHSFFACPGSMGYDSVWTCHRHRPSPI